MINVEWPLLVSVIDPGMLKHALTRALNCSIPMAGGAGAAMSGGGGPVTATNPFGGFGSAMGAPPDAGAAGPTAAGRMMTGRMTGRVGTASGGGDGPRPMTSVKGAGYQSDPSAAKPSFDPLNQAARGPAPKLAEKADNSPEELAKEMEKQVNALIEASADAAVSGDVVQALERAKEAGKKERALQKHRESNGLVDQINLDLTYAGASLAMCLQDHQVANAATGCVHHYSVL